MCDLITEKQTRSPVVLPGGEKGAPEYHGMEGMSRIVHIDEKLYLLLSSSVSVTPFGEKAVCLCWEYNGCAGVLFFSKRLCGVLTKQCSVGKRRSLVSIDLFRGPMSIVFKGFAERKKIEKRPTSEKSVSKGCPEFSNVEEYFLLLLGPFVLVTLLLLL